MLPTKLTGKPVAPLAPELHLYPFISSTTPASVPGGFLNDLGHPQTGAERHSIRHIAAHNCLVHATDIIGGLADVLIVARVLGCGSVMLLDDYSV